MMGIAIIPNWHPVLVHFTIGLLSISALLYLTGRVLRKPNLLIAARWNLWIGTALTVGTVLAGFHAYNTVSHDGPSHAAMTNHKNWALVTASMFGVLALWSLAKHRGAKSVSSSFVVLILLASILLGVTGYKGGEVVYRYGIGVMGMPEITGDGGHGSHSHGEGAEHDMAMPENHHDTATDTTKEPDQKPHDHSSHRH